MELTNAFDVHAPIDRTWRTLTDIELIAPCMPGAQLTEVDGDTYKGSVKIKVGPITAQFKGEASFVEQDEDAHRAVLRAQGRDTGGKGNANATITAHLEPAGADGTRVSITTDLAISGRVAQFGRGALADVSTKLLDQFVACLETDVLSGKVDQVEAPVPAEPSAPSNDGSSPTAEPARRIESAEPEAIDLLGTAGAPLAKRVAPVAIVVAVLLLLLRRRHRRSD
jgi:carbon monoxide dehydrogenase subunit G